MAAAFWVAKEVGGKSSKIGKKKEPWWKRRIENDITNLRRGIIRLERERRGETGRKGKRIRELNAKYRVKKKEINLVIEELKQRRQKLKDMNKGFHNLGETNYFRSTKNRCTKI